MKRIAVVAFLACAAVAVSAQGPSSSFPRGSSQQSWPIYGTWGTASARNQVIAIPTIAQGYTGRAK